MKSSDLLWYFIYLLCIFYKLPTRYNYKVSQFLYEITFESKYVVEGKGWTGEKEKLLFGRVQQRPNWIVKGKHERYQNLISHSL